MKNIEKVLDKLHLGNSGKWDNKFYIISINDSDEYAKIYSKLDSYAVNTEFPNFGVNERNKTTKCTCYFETEVENQEYNIFLIADFNSDTYYLKIGEK